MKKWILFLMALIAIEVSAADYTYKYLVFTGTDGTQTRFATDGLKLNVADNSLVATNAEDTTAFALADLTKMAFAKATDDTGMEADVNGDGIVDVADITAVITAMASSTEPQSGTAPNPQSGTAPNPADVNGDGQVDVADISTVISIMAQ